jgi:hypothetical protein
MLSPHDIHTHTHTPDKTLLWRYAKLSVLCFLRGRPCTQLEFAAFLFIVGVTTLNCQDKMEAFHLILCVKAGCTPATCIAGIMRGRLPPPPFKCLESEAEMSR